MGDDDQLLIERARSGDRMALEQLLVTYSGELRNHIARRLPRYQLGALTVEDAMQEALIRAYLKIDQLRDTSPRAFSTWLRAIGEMSLLILVRAEAAEKRGGQHRKRRDTTDSTGSLVGLLEHLPDEAATASQVVARQEALAALQVAIAGLSDEQRKAVQLNLLHGKSVEETAAEMGRTTGAIRGLVHRAKHSLAQAMGRASVWLSHR